MPTQFKPAGEFIRVERGETLSTGQAVYLNASGQAMIADASSSASMPAVGFVKSIRGENCIIQTTYIVSKSGLNTGDEYWVSTGGEITNTVPSEDGYVLQRVGRAMSSSKLLLNIESQTINL